MRGLKSRVHKTVVNKCIIIARKLRAHVHFSFSGISAASFDRCDPKHRMTRLAVLTGCAESKSA